MDEQEKKKNSKPSKSDIVVDIARTLAKRRHVRNLQLDEISQALKIRVPVLKDLEDGNWDQLPGGVYLKGFLRKYANYLGLDGEKLITPYFQSASVAENQQDEKEEDGKSTEQRDSHTKTLWISVGLGIILLMGLIKFLAHEFQRSSVPVSSSPLVQTEIKKVPEGKTSIVGQEPVDKHLLEVFSPTSLWLGVNARDRSFEGFLPEGSTWSWTGEGKFTIRLGHTKDVSLLFDGEKVDIAENQKRVHLPHEN